MSLVALMPAPTSDATSAGSARRPLRGSIRLTVSESGSPARLHVSVRVDTSAADSVVVLVSITRAPCRSCFSRSAAPFANVNARVVM